MDGPFGVVSAAEFLGIMVFSVFFLWAIYAYTMRDLDLLDLFHVLPKDRRFLKFILFVSLYIYFCFSFQLWRVFSMLLLEITGLRFGMIGLLCMVFLFLPISRGSILLRLVDIPFEHATKYHVWLGHITMAFFSFHGLCYVVAWIVQGRLLELVSLSLSFFVFNFTYFCSESLIKSYFQASLLLTLSLSLRYLSGKLLESQCYLE